MPLQLQGFDCSGSPNIHFTTAGTFPSDPLGGSQTECICVLHAAKQINRVCVLHVANQTNKVCVLLAANQAEAEGLLCDSCHVPDQDRS